MSILTEHYEMKVDVNIPNISLTEQNTGRRDLNNDFIYVKTWGIPAGTVAGSLIQIAIGFTVGDFFKIVDGGVQRTATFSLDYVQLPHVDRTDGFNIEVSSNPARDTINIDNGVSSEHNGGWITIEYTKA